MEGEMVAKENNPFSYTYQKEYYYGEKKLGEYNYDSRQRKTILTKSQFKELKKKVDKMLQRAFCFVDDDFNVEVVVKGGSTINYQGRNKEKFLEKVLDLKRE